MFIFHVESCTDKLPSDYGTVGDQCIGNWTCQELAGKGKCNEDFSRYNDCMPQTTGLVRDYCTVSCETCGKYLISLIRVDLDTTTNLE